MLNVEDIGLKAKGSFIHPIDMIFRKKLMQKH